MWQLPLMAARRDAIANLKWFWGSGTRLNFNYFICIHYAAPPYSVRISPFTISRLAMIVWVPFAVCNA